MKRYFVLMVDELGDEYGVSVEVPDLVDNVAAWVREEYPESSIVYIKKEGI